MPAAGSDEMQVVGSEAMPLDAVRGTPRHVVVLLDDHHVERRGAQIDQPRDVLDLGDPDVELRVPAPCPGRRGGGENAGRRRERADSHDADDAAARCGQAGLGAFERAEHDLGMAHQRRPGIGEDDTPPGTFEQIATRLTLELRQLLRHGRRRDVQGRCRRRDAATQADLVQYAQPTRIQIHEATAPGPWTLCSRHTAPSPSWSRASGASISW